MRSLVAFCLLLSCLSAGISAQARTLEAIHETGFLRIAVYRDFPPYSYLEKGAPAGIDIEIGQKIAEQLGVKPAWFWLTADESLDDDLRNAVWKGHYLGGGVADIMLRVPYDKNYHNDKVSVVGRYHRERWTVARNDEKLPELVNLAPFMYHKIGVEVDSVPDLTLTTALGGRLREQVVHYLSISEAMAALQQGDTDAVAGMRSQLQWCLRGADKQLFAVADDSIVSWPRRAWDIAIAVRKENRQLAEKVDSAIQQFIGGGEMAGVFEKFQVSYEVPAPVVD